MKVEVLNNQSLLDIAVQGYGSVDMAYKLAVDNGLQIDEDLTPGTVLDIDTDNIADANIQQLYESKQIKPATAYDADNEGVFNEVFNDSFR